MSRAQAAPTAPRMGVDNPQLQAEDANADDRPLENQDWRPVSQLEAPPPRPGYAQLWVRTHIRGVEDTANVSKTLQEGWRPRSAESDLPEGYEPPVVSLGRYANVIGAYGMILCEMPLRMYNQRKAHYDGMAAKQSADVANQMKVSDPDKRKVNIAKADVRDDVEFRAAKAKFQDDE